MNFIKDESKAAWKYIWTFVKWLFIAGVTGIVGGLVGTAFNLSVSWATGTRMAHPWLLLLLPVSGLLIAGLYRLTKMENENTNAIIDSIHFGDKVPLMLVPAIFISTTITHLFGGSAAYCRLSSGKAPEDLNEEELSAMGRFACAAAGLSVQRPGGISSVPGKEEILALLAAGD